MKKFVAFLFIIVVSSLATISSANPDNVAQNATITLYGEFFTNGWGGGIAGDKQTLTDGLFFERNHRWDQRTVWWDARYSGGINNYITISLVDTYTLESFVIQADDNDGYILEYWDGNDWAPAWDIPNYNYYNGVNVWGLQTHPDPANNNVRYILPTPIVTNALRFRGDNYDSDKLFSVSEIQAYGEKSSVVPEPSTMILLGTGVLGYGILRRKIKP